MNFYINNRGIHLFQSLVIAIFAPRAPRTNTVLLSAWKKKKIFVGALRIEIGEVRDEVALVFLPTLTFLLAHRNVATAEDVTVAKCRYEDDLGNNGTLRDCIAWLTQACEPDWHNYYGKRQGCLCKSL